MAKGIFITGTDTEIGKTYISSLLIDELCKQGHKVIGMKPIASGAEKVNGVLKNEDAMQLMQHANVDCPYELVNPYCFEPAIAPHIAAERINNVIDLEVIKKAYFQLANKADFVVVEGVGGWSVPINNKQRVADIPGKLTIPVVLVVGMRLGCINHALLTAAAIRANGNTLLGWIANDIDPQMSAYQENLRSLEARLGCPLIAHVPHSTQLKNDPNQNISINIAMLNA